MFEMADKEHLMDILIEVNRRLAEDFMSKGLNKQMPEPKSMLTHRLYFRPGIFDELKDGAYKMSSRPRDVYKMSSKPRGVGEQ